MKRFYIIGNGFDLHHGLPTGLNDFRKYLKSHNPNCYKFINNIIADYNPSFDSNDWNRIEDELVCTTELDYDHMLEEAIASAETDMDRASYWHDIPFNADYFNRDFPDFKRCFDSWIDSIDIRAVKRDASIHFGTADVFLTFNYTDTLQLLYGVSDSRILHIHGSKETEKVFGHNVYFEDPLPRSQLTQEDFDHGIEDDWRIEEAKMILNRIPALFYKNSAAIIEANQSFLYRISAYDEIVFMGWSLGAQDEIYMSKILSERKPDSKIRVVYHSADAAVKARYENFLKRYQIQNVSYHTWDEVERLFCI